MLEPKRRAYVMDFGIGARPKMAFGVDTGCRLDRYRPDYMSPDNQGAFTLDARSDLFNRLHHLVNENPQWPIPFESDTTMESLEAQRANRLGLSRTRYQTIPQALCDIVRKCLEIYPQSCLASAMNCCSRFENLARTVAGTRLGSRRPFLPAYAKCV